MMSCKVAVNIKDLKNKCPKSFDIAMNKAAQQSITIDLNKLIKEPQAFADVLCFSIDKFTSSARALGKVVDLYKKSVRRSDLDKIISNKIIEQIDAVGSRGRGWKNKYKYGKEIPEVIEKCSDIFSADDKKKLLEIILKRHNQFYPYARKMLATTASSIASNDEDRVSVITSFYKVMEKTAFFNIVNEIDGGMEHKAIKKILDKTKKFNVCKYTKDDISSDKSKKIELLKDIARSPSSAKNLSFRVSFTIPELEELAPVMRFSLLKWFFKEKFKIASLCANRPQLYQQRWKRVMKSSATTNIGMPTFKEEELRKLLFSVGFKKNQETDRFLKAYMAYNKIKSGTHMTRQDAREAFGREYGYYYYY